MPVKWLLYWQPNAGITVNTQILTEISQCVESSINGVKGGRWKSTLIFYRPITRDQTSQNDYPKDLLGVSLPEQPDKYYFVLRSHRIVFEADSNIQSIMEKAQSYKARIALTFEGFQYQLGDFQLKVGKVALTAHAENLRGIAMEVEYLPLSSLDKSRQVMEDFVNILQEIVSSRSLPDFGQLLLTGLVADIQNLAAGMESVIFKHQFKEADFAAGFLAKAAAANELNRIGYSDPPEKLKRTC